MCMHDVYAWTGAYVYVCTWVYTYVSVYLCGCLACIYIYLCVGHVLQCSDLFGEIRIIAGDSNTIRIRAVVDPIQW